MLCVHHHQPNHQINLGSETVPLYTGRCKCLVTRLVSDKRNLITSTKTLGERFLTTTHMPGVQLNSWEAWRFTSVVLSQTH